MRILKYLFLLLLLSLVALTIYIATQKGNFTVKSSRVINSPKATVFDYVNDYKNWPKFSSWIESDNTINLSYSPITNGNGSTFAWEGPNDIGNIETIYTKGNDSIVQKMEFNGTSSDVYWSFKDTVGGTKVVWKSVGKMDFMLKVNSFLTGGKQNSLSRIYDKCLANLDKALGVENSTYDVKINGIVKKLETHYLRQSFTSKISDITRNANAVFPKIITFCEQNNLALSGRPFIIYHTYDTINNLTKVSFCIPIKEQIFTSEGSDIISGKLIAFEAVKTSLRGNYTFKNKALAKTAEYTANKHILTGTTFSHLEIFTIGKNESLSPSKWLTDIYFPIQPKVIPTPYKKIVKDSTASKPSPIEKPAVKAPAEKAPVVKTPAAKTPATKVAPTEKAPATKVVPAEKAPPTKKSQEDFEF